MTTTAVDQRIALAARFEAAAQGARRDQRTARGNHERWLVGYGSIFGDSAAQLRLFGWTPEELAESVSLYAQTYAQELEAGGFDALRHRNLITRADQWVTHGRLTACRTVLEILASQPDR